MKKTCSLLCRFVFFAATLILALLAPSCGGSDIGIDQEIDAGSDTDSDTDTDKDLKGMWECLICN